MTSLTDFLLVVVVVHLTNGDVARGVLVLHKLVNSRRLTHIRRLSWSLIRSQLHYFLMIVMSLMKSIVHIGLFLIASTIHNVQFLRLSGCVCVPVTRKRYV